jgi:outer membrane protein assembly factor BamB
MPLIFSGAVGLAGAVEATGNGYVPPPPALWLNLLTGSNLQVGSNYNYNAATDANNNVYTVGSVPINPGGRAYGLYKYNNTGVLQWSIKLYTTYYYDDAYSVEVDSAGNVYVTGNLFWGFGGFSTMGTAKYNSSGVLQWKTPIMDNFGGNYSQSGGGEMLIAKDLVLDSSSNVYIAGPNNLRSNSELAKYDTAGTIQWQRSISFSGGSSITLDSSNNIYVGSSGAGYFAKFDNAGTVLWSRDVAQGGAKLNIRSMNVDSSDNVYVHGYINDNVTSMNKQIVMKYNSSGTVLWQRKIGHAWIGNASGYTTPAGDTYLIGTSNDAGSTAGVKAVTIIKYNSSGTLQFQRYFKSNVANVAITPSAIRTLGSDRMVFTGHSDVVSAGGITYPLTVVLLNDGTGTKTYTAAGYSWTYGICSDAEAAASITSNVGNATAATTTYSTTPANWNDQTSTTLSVTSNTSVLS